MYVIIFLALMNGAPVAATDGFIYNDSVTCMQALKALSNILVESGILHEGECKEAKLKPI